MSDNFKYRPFSKKQKQVLTWWQKPIIDNLGNIISKGSPHHEKDVLICDGAVRSGKTLIMSLSYVIWSMSEYNLTNFGMAGKTVGSFKRNVWLKLKQMLIKRGYRIRRHKDTDSSTAYVISKNGIENYYFIFGGKDERSQDFLQGFTAGGFLLDEVALMPESFVNQAVARCSEEGAKIWFNCNPSGPFHWFKLNWIDKLEEKNAIRLHFLLEDNPSLSMKVIAKYKRMFSGIFFERYILGLWVLAEGIVYSMFKREMVIDKIPSLVKIVNKWIGVDYGQANATTFILCGLGSDDKLYILDEYYHSGRESSIQKSPLAYAKDFNKWLIKNGVEGMPTNYEDIFIDPSAKGFILQLHEESVRRIKQAINDVNRGIELFSSLIEHDSVRVLKKCKNTINELSTYRWDPKYQARGEDKPLKENDHCLDGVRYVVNGKRQLLQRLVRMKAA